MRYKTNMTDMLIKLYIQLHIHSLAKALLARLMRAFQPDTVRVGAGFRYKSEIRQGKRV